MIDDSEDSEIIKKRKTSVKENTKSTNTVRKQVTEKAKLKEKEVKEVKKKTFKIDEKILDFKKMHLFIILFGVVFICMSIFHDNLWVDEAYSVAMANKSFSEIWQLGANDVHPVLYYFVLHIISILTGGSVIVLRLFSALGIIAIGILGYTHIRKDFGEKVGFVFSLLTFFLPEMAIHANEIRMYSWACFFVTLLAIYAYRLKFKPRKKDWIVFAISSIVCIYIHYYALLAAFMISIVLLFYYLYYRDTKSMYTLIEIGVLQLLVYIPWILNFASQIQSVASKFSIGFKFPDTLIELTSFQLIGNLNYYIGFAIAIVIYIFLIYSLKKIATETEETLYPVMASITIYLMVIVIALVLSLILNTELLTYRYLFVMSGLYIFVISYIVGKQDNNHSLAIICTLVIGLGTISNCMLTTYNYDESNGTQFTYILENIEKGDVIVYSDFDKGSVFASKFKNVKEYYYNPNNEGVEAKYTAFAPLVATVTDTEFLEDVKGKIWLIDDKDKTLYNNVFKNKIKANLVKEKYFETKYQNYTYNILEIEKK